jgi:hypothetical protein
VDWKREQTASPRGAPARNPSPRPPSPVAPPPGRPAIVRGPAGTFALPAGHRRGGPIGPAILALGR